MQYWYDQQIRRYILQFIRLFDDFSVKVGKKNNSDSNSYIRVPVRYADMSRMVAHILRHNSENVMNSCPFMSAYITNLQIARDRLQEPRLVDKVQVAERKYDTSSKNYTAEIGNTYTVERFMPVPYNLNMAVDIWCSNTDQKLCQVFGKCWVRAVDLTTRLRRVIGTPGARPRCGLRRFFLSKKPTPERKIK